MHYELSQKAFNLADHYQTPVFILSDQYFADVFYNQPKFRSGSEVEEHIIKTDSDYEDMKLQKMEYLPGEYQDLVRDSLLLTLMNMIKMGHLTENLDIRTEMVDKRLRKLKEN